MKKIVLFGISAIIITIIILILVNNSEPFCCGDKTWRRIDVVYPPDIYIGERGPFNAFTGFRNPWVNRDRDAAFVEQRLSNPNRVVFLDN